jgi:hypothetical protein
MPSPAPAEEPSPSTGAPLSSTMSTGEPGRALTASSYKKRAYLLGAGVMALVGVGIALLLPTGQLGEKEPSSRPETSIGRARQAPPSAALAGGEIEGHTPNALAPPSRELEQRETPPSAASDGSADPAGAVAPPADSVDVQINIRPEGARVFYRGKEVGRSPFTLQFPRGERRAYEAAFPDYHTRRFVVDDSRREVSFKMRTNK